MKILEQLRVQPGWLTLCCALVLVVAVGTVDGATGNELSFSIFYLLPVLLSSAYCTRPQRWTICIVSAGTSLLADFAMTPRFSEPWIPYWNASVRLGIFLVVSELTAQLSSRNKALQAEVTERTRAEAGLQELNSSLERQVAERTAAAESRAADLARSERELRKQAEILRSILNSLSDGVIVGAPDGAILLRNPEADRLLGMDGGCQRIQDWIEQQRVCLPETLSGPRESQEHPLLGALHGRKVDVAEMFVARSSGDGVWLRTTARPILGEDGASLGGVIAFSDITARKLLERQVADISDREQQRIGQELHDGVCQQLVSAAYACGMLADSLAGNNLPERTQALEINQLLKGAIVQTRNLAHALHCLDLTGDGLGLALEELAAGVQLATRIECRFRSECAVTMTDAGLALNLYRIAQEAVNNAVKHSRASEILIELTESNEWLTLSICDNGVGLNLGPAPKRGMGLHIMHYRARIIGASLEVERRSQGGTLVTCSVRRLNSAAHVPS